MRGELPIIQTTLERTFKDGVGKVFEILNSVDLIEQLRLSIPAVTVRLEKELKRLRGLKFKIPIAVSLEKIIKFEFIDPKEEREIPTQVEEQKMYFNSRVKTIVMKPEIVEAVNRSVEEIVTHMERG